MAVLDLLLSTAHLSNEPLHVICDSQYVIKSVTEWMPGWKRRGWRKADGKPVLNREILEQIDAALFGRKVQFEWVKGHAGHPLNEAADTRARNAATAYQQGSMLPQGPGVDTSRGRSSPETHAEKSSSNPSLETVPSVTPSSHSETPRLF